MCSNFGKTHYIKCIIYVRTHIYCSWTFSPDVASRAIIFLYTIMLFRNFFSLLVNTHPHSVDAVHFVMYRSIWYIRIMHTFKTSLWIVNTEKKLSGSWIDEGHWKTSKVLTLLFRTDEKKVQRKKGCTVCTHIKL